MEKLAQPFFIGGTIVAGTTYLAQYVSPKLAAIFWSFPITLLPTIYFLHQHGQNDQKVGDFVKNAGLTSVILLIWTFGLYFILKEGVFKKTEHTLLYSIFLTSLVWIVFSYLFYKYSN